MRKPEHEGPSLRDDEAGIKEVLGLFDIPAFARRGYELEQSLLRLDARLARERLDRLEMPRLRLKQWASVATGWDDWSDVFEGPINDLHEPCGAEPPAWAAKSASPRRRRAVARDLVASLTRFNLSWVRRIDQVGLDAVNRQIERYNRYYLLEKECVLGSSRLASRHYVPQPLLTRERLLIVHPILPRPELRK